MRPVFQTKFSDLSLGVHGNCLAAALASLLGIPLDRVPKFEVEFDIDTPFWEIEQMFRRCCEQNGFYYHGRKPPPCPKDNRYYIGSFKVPETDRLVHAVIIRNGKIIHDPRPPEKRVPLRDLYSYFDIRRKTRCPRKRKQMLVAVESHLTRLSSLIQTAQDSLTDLSGVKAVAASVALQPSS